MAIALWIIALVLLFGASSVRGFLSFIIWTIIIILIIYGIYLAIVDDIRQGQLRQERKLKLKQEREISEQQGAKLILDKENRPKIVTTRKTWFGITVETIKDPD